MFWVEVVELVNGLQHRFLDDVVGLEHSARPARKAAARPFLQAGQVTGHENVPCFQGARLGLTQEMNGRQGIQPFGIFGLGHDPFAISAGLVRGWRRKSFRPRRLS